MENKLGKDTDKYIRTGPGGDGSLLPMETEHHRRVYTDRMAELTGVIGSYLYYIRGRKSTEPCNALFFSITRLCDELKSLALLEAELEKDEAGEL